MSYHQKVLHAGSIIWFIGSLPFVIGIKGDVNAVEDVYFLLAEKEVKIPGFVDLGYLAVLAGWNQPINNILTLHAGMLGTVLNKVVSHGDSTWGRSWGSLDRSLRAYCIMNVGHRHIIFNVLSGLLLRELFPDPEGACYVTGTLQFEFVEWFNSYLVQVLTGMDISNPDLQSMVTRKEVMSIRYRRSN